MIEQTEELNPGVYRFHVEGQYAGLRLDQYLSTVSPQISRTQARRLIDLGAVHCAGRRVRRCSQQVMSGTLIEVYVDRLSSLSAEMLGQRIIYHDQYIIAIDKPPGVATQPAPSRFKGTVYSALIDYLSQQGLNRLRPSIGMIQRLDQGTSGVMVFSIHPQAHKPMTEHFKTHSIRKIYWAQISGHLSLKKGEFQSCLARRRSTNLMVSVNAGGKMAVTRYRLMKELKFSSLVEIELVTGRTHQIRVHFSEAGFPLLGDTAYGGPGSLGSLNISRPMLHARQISFLHPITQEQLVLSAPLPDDFIKLLKSSDAA